MSTTTAISANRRTATEVLLEHGLNGDRLLKLARRIANDAQRKAPAGLGGKYEDLVSFLTLQALEAAVGYDPSRRSTNGSYTFASYLCDIMERRVTDFYRRKSEGFGDSRSGSNGRIVLSGDALEHEQPDEPEPLHPEIQLTEAERRYQLWAHAAGLISTPMHDWDHIDERVVMDWARAAERQGIPLDAWVRRTLKQAAREAA
jgi:DNA-directed RNA polymerase specialized sigma24 family protein